MKQLVIVGAGLTGSVLVNSLISHMEASSVEFGVVIVDYDRLENRNCVGNHNTRLSSGELKSSLLADRLEAYGHAARAISHKLTPKNAKIILGQASIIIGAVDNVAARRAMWTFATENEIPYMDIGLNRANFAVAWTFNGVDTMMYSPKMGKEKEIKEVKEAPCDLIGTRIQAVFAAEAASKSLMIFDAGADPNEIVLGLVGRKAEHGDMVGWSGVSTGTEYNVSTSYLGGVQDE